MTQRRLYPLNKVRLPLFWKFAIAISITVILFGTLNLLFIRYQVYRTFEAQIERSGLSIASLTAEQLIDPILYNEPAAINKVLQQTKSVSHDIEYLMVISPDEMLISHTFANTPSQDLVNANNLSDAIPYNIRIIHSLSSNDTIIRDIAVPIMSKRLGTLRIGFTESVISQQLGHATRMFIALVVLLLIFGIIAAFFLSYIIAKPVNIMSQQLSQVNLRSIEAHGYRINLKTGNLLLRMKNMMNMTDEIDVLANSFNEMLYRLNKAYIDLQKIRDSLTQTEKLASVGTLAAGLAHEINNPLAGINNCLRRISDKPENISQNKEYIQMMTEAVDKIGGVVKGLLDFSRKHEMNYSRINLIQHIENSISLVNFQLRQSNIQLFRKFESPEIMITGSPNHLEQVFVNLILNSIEAIDERKLTEPDHKGTIIIDVRRSHNSVFLDFIDNGKGLPESKIPHMFEPFFTEKKVKSGTGLGLAVSCDIIRNHHGTVTGRNASDGGFVISLTIPDDL
jgi:two-component system NtrC family sensor kinase